ncbi:MAG: hybrid sensor histidine kinase/response regulator [Desulfuromonadaceae bacterium]
MKHQGTAKDYFFDEAQEHLTLLETGLLRLEAEDVHAPDPELIDALFRSAHTLKGASALLKYTAISDIAHEFEELLEQIRDKRIILNVPLTDAMLGGIDAMRTLVHSVDRQEYAATAAQAGENFSRMVHQALQEDPASSKSDGTAVQQSPPSADQGRSTVKVDLNQIDTLMNLLGEITVNKSHMLDQMNHTETMKEEIDFARDRLLREVRVFSDRHEYSIFRGEENPEAKKAALPIADFDELEFDRYDELNLFSRKLQEISNDINEALADIRGYLNNLSIDIEAMDRMTVEMKERISGMRTLPVEHLYHRFKRTFRNLIRAEDGISAALVFEGGDTRIGRTVIDGLFEPVVHLLRNCLAHGIEPENERRSAGKAPEGTIKIRTQRRGNSALISISDDGRGIQMEKVRQKALELGWIEPDQHLDRREILDLIFHPGFSTRTGADELSGRGVGMDVVLESISALNGSVDVVSEEGKGTTINLQIPLSLVIINVVQFRIGQQLFVLPTALIEEIQDYRDLEVVEGHVLRQNERYRIVNLNTSFSIPEIDASRRCVLFVKTMGTRIGLGVEEVINQEDTVIRPFGPLLESMRCFSGTSVSGGGDIRLVVNPSRLSDTVNPVVSEQISPDDILESSSSEPDKKLRVMVVDDSLSVRKYASMILEGSGVEVLNAVNGQDALERLDTDEVDIIFTDLEMPVMHGYELLGELKRRESLSSIPVVVITSRAGEQHRQKALNAGASGYLIKPFDEQTLLEKLREFVPGYN